MADPRHREEVLIIDGDRDIQCTLSELLSKDYKIEIAETFEGALDLVKDKYYDVVIIPIDKFGVKAVEILHKFKQVKSDLPVVVITTPKTASLAVEAVKAGAYDYLTKPFSSEELKIVIAHAAEWHKLVDEAKEKKVFQELSLLDGLTHIYNRRYFDELLERETRRASRYPQKFSLLLADIDNFKSYNDTYGHVAGDGLLKNLAAFLLDISRSTDFLARYGGEEFAIITPQTDKKAASFLATRIVLLVANKDFTGNKGAHLTISIGVATFDDDAKTKEDLIKRADEALYQAKKLGKNRVCMFGQL